MSDEKTKALVVQQKEKEVYGPSPILSILAELKELLDDKEVYRP